MGVVQQQSIIRCSMVITRGELIRRSVELYSDASLPCWVLDVTCTGQQMSHGLFQSLAVDMPAGRPDGRNLDQEESL